MKLQQKIFFFICIFHFSNYSHSQTLENGCVKANFGIDADLYANGSEFGNAINPSNNTDDWFIDPSIYSGSGFSVIDTFNSFFYRQQLQAENNIFFTQPMSQPTATVINGIKWEDAAYVRDQYGGNASTDNSAYTSASKNGEDPQTWSTGPMNVTPKNDLIDCFAHLRRDGVSVDDPLWLFLTFSRISNKGESYFDAEIFAKNIQYVPGTGFISEGLEEGHTAWQFDQDGNITEVGDMIVTVNMSTNGAPTFELRIWVRRFDFNNTTPATFSFGNDFNGGSNNSTYGYADILPPANSEFGCGLVNPSTWAAPPWGTLNSGGDFSTFYEKNQLVEIGLNLYEFGIDPRLVVGSNPCSIPFQNLVFKSRASNAFTAQLKDFSGPFEFEIEPILTANILGDTAFQCGQDFIELSVDSTYPSAFYQWTTLGGNIISNPSDTTIIIDQPGVYIIASAFAAGCELHYDTINVSENIIYPNAFISSSNVSSVCDGNSTILTAEPAGSTFNWTGPNGFVAIDSQQVHVTTPGKYYLEVINEYGCPGIDSVYLLEYPCQNIDDPSIQIIEILDTLPPSFTAPTDITVNCQIDLSDLSITGNVIDIFDECDQTVGTLITAVYSDEFFELSTCLGTGEIIRTWSLTDNCGNNYSAIQKITIVDNNAPTFIPPPNITLSCEFDPLDLTITGEPTGIVDNCSEENFIFNFSDFIVPNTSCPTSFTIHRTWIVEDNCGNANQFIQFIAIEDNTPPIISGLPVIGTIQCDSIPTPPTITATDICDDNPTIVMTEFTSLSSCPDEYILTRTWTATDACGNSSQVSQVLNVQDSGSPVVLSFPGDITVSCDSVPEITEPNAIDNCDPNIDIVYDEVRIDGSCPNNYTLEYHWEWEDNCNNISTHVHRIIVEDTTPPSFISPQDITLDCATNIDDLNITGQTTNESDNCDNSIGDAIYSDEINWSCEGNGTVIRTWSLSDACGNTTNQTQVITLIDTIGPTFSTPPNLTIDCDSDITNLTITGIPINVSDNCFSNIGIPFYTDELIASSTCGNEKVINRTWTLEDDCGNITSSLQIITLIDTIPPILDIPNDVTIDCGTDVEDLNEVGIAIAISDNCDSILSTPTYTDILLNNGSCLSEATIERTWSLTDACNNTVTATQIISIIDTIPPVFNVPEDLSISCDQDFTDLILTGTASGEVGECYPISNQATYTDSIIVDYPCEGSILVFRNWELDDGCGNITTDIQVISIEDTTPPLLEIPQDITLSCFTDLENNDSTGIAQINGDNCSNNFGPITFIDSVLVNNFCNAEVMRIWLGSDACGNVAADTQMISIIENVPPTAPFPNDTILYLNVDCLIDTTILNIGNVSLESDNCSSTTINYSDDVSGLTGCSGTGNIYRNWVILDECGNELTHQQTISIQDTIPPSVIDFPQDITVECNNIPLIPELVVIDNCDNNISMSIVEDSIIGICLDNYLLKRIWTYSDPCGNISNFTQTITVQNCSPEITIDLQNGNQLCESETLIIEATLTSGYTSPVFQWNFSNNNGTTWMPIPNATNNIFQKENIMQEDEGWYQLIIAEDNLGLSVDSCNVSSEIIEIYVVSPSPNTILNFDLCDGDSIEISNTFYFSNTQVIDTFTNILGCDSIVINNIIFHPNFEFIENQNICQGDVFNGITIENDTTIQIDFQTTFGCDSIFIYEINAIQPITEILNFDLCVGDMHEGISYSQDTILIKSFQSILGCDSIVQEVINVHEPFDTQRLVTLCEGDFFEGNIYFNDTTWIENYSTAFGCDSIITTIISINEIQFTTLNFDLCDEDSIEISNTFYFSNAQVIDTFTNVLGCDSIVTNNITFHPNFEFIENQNICQGDTFNGITIENDTTIQIDFQTTFGCDSIFIYEITAIQPITEILNFDLCVGDMHEGISYFQDSILIKNFQSILGCDSIVQEVINVHEPFDTQRLVTICEGDLFEGNIYFNDTTWVENYSTSFGCDSVITTSISINEIQFTEINIELCQGEEYNNQVINQNEILIDTLNSIHGCDSIITTNIAVNLPSNSQLNIIVCENESYQGTVYFNDTTIVNHLTNFAGCDSIENISIQVLQNEIINEDIELCFGETYQGQTYFQSIIFTDSLLDIHGCDSIIIKNIIVENPISTNLDIEICEGQTYLGQTYFTDTTLINNLISENGCDSIVTTSIVVLQNIQTNSSTSICFGDDYNGVTITNDTIIITTNINSFGCDSINTNEIFVIDNYSSVQDVFLCEGQTFNGVSYFENSQNIDSLTSTFGCDSIVIHNIFVAISDSSNIEVAICEGQSYLGQSFVNDTIIVNQLTALNGCDSIVTISIDVLQKDTTNISTTICQGETFNGIYIQNDTTIISITQNSFGCDSIIFNQVLVLENFTTNQDIFLCVGQTFNGIVYNENSQTTENLTASNGCDSIVNNNIFVEPQLSTNLNIVLCEGEAYLGQTYFNDTVIVNQLISVFGCDSIITTTINVEQPSSSINSIKICEGETFNGITINNDTTIITTTQNSFGCENVITNQISVLENFTTNQDIFLCQGEAFNGVVYSTNSQVVLNLTSSNSCDSIVINNIFIEGPSSSNLEIELCVGQPYLGQVYSNDTILFQQLTSHNGCDSLATTSITVSNNIQTNLSTSLCIGETYNGFTINNDTTFITITQNSFGCDSIITNQISVIQEQLTIENILLCEGEIFNGIVYTENTQIIDSLTSVFGCDSIVINNIQIKNPIEFNLEMELCEGQTYLGQNYFNDTTLINQLISFNGCDSIVNTNIKINQPKQTNITEQICEGQLYNGVAYTQNVTLYQNLFTSKGCDSLVIISLEIKDKIRDSVYVNLCQGENLFINGNYQSSNGIFHETYNSSTGCDSIVTAFLNFHEKYNLHNLISICENDSVLINNEYRTQSGIFIENLKSINGCDSVVVNELRVNNNNLIRFEESTICYGDSILIFDTWRFESGEYTETLSNSNGCDSVVIHNLNFIEEELIFTEDEEICFGEEVELILEGAENINVTWSPSYGLSCTNCNNPIAFPQETTTYTVSYQSNCKNEIIESNVTVTVKPMENPQVDDLIDVLRGDSVLLFVKNINPNAKYIWKNEFGETICDSNCPSVWVYPTQSTFYTVAAIIENGCPLTQRVDVIIQNNCTIGTLNIPNIILPKSGGYGEMFEIEYEDMHLDILRIYNRWGELVFETEDLSIKWDGTFRGEPLNPGVYVYYIKGRCLNEDPFMRTGNVTLIN